MIRSRALLAVMLLACLCGVAAVADALVVTDEEQLEEFVDALSGEVSGERIDEALEYVATDRLPLEVSSPDREYSFDAQDAEFASRVHGALVGFLGEDVELIQHNIRLEGDTARVHLRVRAGQDTYNISARLSKVGGRWLVRRGNIS